MPARIVHRCMACAGTVAGLQGRGTRSLVLCNDGGAECGDCWDSRHYQSFCCRHLDVLDERLERRFIVTRSTTCEATLTWQRIRVKESAVVPPINQRVLSARDPKLARGARTQALSRPGFALQRPRLFAAFRASWRVLGRSDATCAPSQVQAFLLLPLLGLRPALG